MGRHGFVLRLLAGVMVLALTGCAGQAVREEAPPTPRAAVSIDSFSLDGRLQVKEGERSAAVGVQWRHASANDEWLFTGPLGQGLARLESGPQGALLVMSDGRQRSAGSVAELAELLLGVAAPFDRLGYWATGRPADGAEVRQSDAAGRPLRIVDRGWIVDYLDYTGPLPSDPPRKLEVHRGDALLRLIIDAWNP